MSDDVIKGDWKQLKGKVRAKWGKLTDDDVETVAGRKEQLIGKLQERYGHAKDEATRQVDAFYHEVGDSNDADEHHAPRASR
jgi:uncharacterized protein YjbJ (UPF0337 family)